MGRSRALSAGWLWLPHRALGSHQLHFVVGGEASSLSAGAPHTLLHAYCSCLRAFLFGQVVSMLGRLVWGQERRELYMSFCREPLAEDPKMW